MSFKEQKTFCPAPWMHLHIINDGRAFACCSTPIEDENCFGNVKEQTLEQIMNGDKIKQFRKDMLEGKELPEACTRCTQKEVNGLNSMRTGFNDHWYDSVKDYIEKETKPDGSLPTVIDRENHTKKTDIRMKYWDIRFSNFCNLACTTCSPLFSTKWQKDWKKLHMGQGGFQGKALIDLEQDKGFWEDLENNYHHMEEIMFAGGEPLIMPEHNRLIKMLDENEKYDVFLKYSTNATTKIDKVMPYWQKFYDNGGRVHLSLSIDGVGPSFEHIRYHGKWPETLANLKMIRKSGCVDYWFHPTISILNIFRLTEIHEELRINDLLPLKNLTEKHEFWIENYWTDRFHMNVLFTPEYYSIQVLPELLKQRAAEKITKYGKNLEIQTGIPFKGWQDLIDFMFERDRSDLWFQFKLETNKMDRLRGTNLYEINPELRTDDYIPHEQQT